ncbi:MAG: response regulator [Lachnospiraceae bacterium]|jgi:Response regulators consisting of a CheY-like receiver domain and a winged-helix DNA-binding domain|uniref:response regulator n=1 Tax=Roseburia sp. 1XD42-69 TaxID=2320088 RepID=UPI000EA19EE5|nr:response regulator [Roseburia sp. 1XD42-69]MCI8875688.1 response regulator [Lachnospiraceae bacterium]MCX4318205.1 response regulator [Lachnospiraceae bacterium]RKJ67778.1 response regulator [Roseburia sp. 1XD42-69]
MKILLAEDDFASRKFMDKYLSQYGECDATVDGEEAVNAYLMALEDEEPYDLICLDVMMPVMNGYQALEAIRKDEAERGVEKEDRVKIIMATALSGERVVDKAKKLECEAYAGKPIDVEEFDNILRNLGLIS